ncbi:guanylate kinase [Lactobacillus sp. LL6]|uniref:guanylate kinase n=1 Tax=Lactobacillus sp. LL6 TaxID=2596827 RepID=UPI001185AE77|nr:guanylate kinase [Lactobacillus sp. LL6]TSO25717.1 guanylate kinase [Lactobacillus sp. LL6]
MKKIILIAGPSGAGKTTISEYLTRKYGIPRVITHTTRPMREGEVADKSYYFETDESFNKLHFFEHVKYGKFKYGSSKEALENAWKDHDIVSLIVDIQGIKSYLTQLKGQAYFLYVTASNIDELKERLIRRGDTVEMVRERLSGSELNPLPNSLKQDAHILYNDVWNDTEEKLDLIISKIESA